MARGEAGFLLIEALVGLMILAMVVTIVLVSIGRSSKVSRASEAYEASIVEGRAVLEASMAETDWPPTTNEWQVTSTHDWTVTTRPYVEAGLSRREDEQLYEFAVTEGPLNLEGEPIVLRELKILRSR